MSSLSWHYDYVHAAVEYLVDGTGSLNTRLFNAWKSMHQLIEPLHYEKFPKELRPVYLDLVENLHRVTRSSTDKVAEEDEKEAAKELLLFYRYLTEYRAVSEKDSRLDVKDILAKRRGSGFVEISPDGISTGQVLSLDIDDHRSKEILKCD